MTTLVLDSVERRYDGPPAVHALLPTTLTIQQGETVAVVGPSGSGKSTLLNILGLLDRPTAGRYEVSGVDVDALDERERTSLRASRFGFVFQDFQLLPDRTAIENVALGLLYQAIPACLRVNRARRVLRQVGLAHRLNALPNQLSGGERQRVAIARAVAQEAAVLLCDEPTGNLDPDTAQQVLGLLRGVNDTGVTLVIVTHDGHVASTCRRVVHLSSPDLA